MGDNVFYVLGNSFVWTWELIQEFRNCSYWLAFHNTKREFTSAVAWETIDMSKPNDTSP
jgi:hypothetical protein